MNLLAKIVPYTEQQKRKEVDENLHKEKSERVMLCMCVCGGVDI